jgi:hypothetical protein
MKRSLSTSYTRYNFINKAIAKFMQKTTRRLMGGDILKYVTSWHIAKDEQTVFIQKIEEINLQHAGYHTIK